MKAITLTQPYASLVAGGFKEVETRSWRTRYTGPLVIHAGVKFPPEYQALCSKPPFHECLPDDALEVLPRGAALCVVELLGCVPIVGYDGRWMERVTFALGHPMQFREMAYGNYGQGRWAWPMRLLKVFRPPVQMQGAMGLWDCPGIDLA